jgi:hypothetical protein
MPKTVTSNGKFPFNSLLTSPFNLPSFPADSGYKDAAKAGRTPDLMVRKAIQIRSQIQGKKGVGLRINLRKNV